MKLNTRDIFMIAFVAVVCAVVEYVMLRKLGVNK